MVKVIFHTIWNYSGSTFFPLREVPILKRDAIEENHCLVQYSPLDVGNFQHSGYAIVDTTYFRYSKIISYRFYS